MKQEQVFLLVLSPSEKVSNHIKDLKTYAFRILGHYFPSVFSQAHISIGFCFREADLYTIENTLREFNSFHVFIKDWKVFNHGENGTLYLDIVNKNPIIELCEALHIKPITPHLTVARNVNAVDLKVIQEKLTRIPYSNSFRCDRLTVLKRVNEKWESYMEIPLAA